MAKDNIVKTVKIEIDTKTAERQAKKLVGYVEAIDPKIEVSFVGKTTGVKKKISELKLLTEDVEAHITFTSNINELENKFNKVKGAIGKFNKSQGASTKMSKNNARAVRGVAKEYDALSFSMVQLAREGPAFMYSMELGFMAISNNLPIFFDSVSRAKEEIDTMNKEGKKVPSIWKRMGKSMLSVQMLLSMFVVALTLFGPKIGNFISSLFTAAGAVQTLEEKLDSLQKMKLHNDARISALEAEIKVLKRLGLAYDGLLRKQLIRAKANQVAAQQAYDAQKKANMLFEKEAATGTKFRSGRPGQSYTPSVAGSISSEEAKKIRENDTSLAKLEEQIWKAVESVNVLEEAIFDYGKEAEEVTTTTTTTSAAVKDLTEDLRDLKNEAQAFVLDITEWQNWRNALHQLFIDNEQDIDIQNEKQIEYNRQRALDNTSEIEDEIIKQQTIEQINIKFNDKQIKRQEEEEARDRKITKDNIVYKLSMAASYASALANIANAVAKARAEEVDALIAKGITEGEEYDKAVKRRERAAIAGVIMDTGSAIMSTWASYMSTPGGAPGAVLAGIQTIALIATAAAQIKTIKNKKLTDAGTHGGGGGTGGSPNYNVVSENEYNPINDVVNNTGLIAEGLKDPLKAYVVAKDVTTQQELDRQVESSSSI